VCRLYGVYTCEQYTTVQYSVQDYVEVYSIVMIGRTTKKQIVSTRTLSIIAETGSLDTMYCTY
jgi:hypothetical protein